MPTWTEDLPRGRGTNSYRIVRTPTELTLTGHVTSEKLLCSMVHWFGGRTVPHEIEGVCKPCEANRPIKWIALISCVDDVTHEHVIFETTACAAAPFKDYLQRYKTLRGATFYAHRPNKLERGRISIAVRPKGRQTMFLPAAPDLVAVMTHIWYSTLDLAMPPNGLNEQHVLLAREKDNPAPDTSKDNGQPAAAPGL